MPSSSRPRSLAVAVILLAAGTQASRARAQQHPQGFAVERFYPSAPGGGWFVMDALDMHGGLGGALALTSGYARNPLILTDGSRRLAVVSDQAFLDVGAAVTFDRFRLYLNLNTPLVIRGDSGTIGDSSIAAPSPSVDLASHPDTLSDARIGVDVRLVGRPGGGFRLGAGAQLIVPNGNRADYDTDGSFHGMARVLFAGDAGPFTYAGHLGVHIRPLDDPGVPGSPRGSELLYGIAAGAKLAAGRSMAVIVGPEIFGATAFRSLLDSGLGWGGTALEALLGARIEGTADDRMQLRVKLGGGAGISQHLGAPEWRLVLGIEVFRHGRRR